jgi:hypothetical protein
MTAGWISWLHHGICRIALYEQWGRHIHYQTKAWRWMARLGALNLNHTDFNDGWLDLYIMRGAWYQVGGDIISTLLMNTGKGYFEDVTVKSGLMRIAASQNSAWADFNLDGWVDLVAGNESFGEYERGIDFYVNQKDGTFKRIHRVWIGFQKPVY